MKARIRFILLILIWSSVALRFLYPADLHGGYGRALNTTLVIVDLILIYPPFFVIQSVFGKIPEALTLPLIGFLWPALLTRGDRENKAYFGLVPKVWPRRHLG